MKRSKKIVLYSGYAVLSLALLISLTVQYGCEKLDPQRKTIIKTVSVGSITFESCKITGEIVDMSEQGISEHGFCYAITSSPTIEDSKVELGSEDKAQSFTGTLLALNPNTNYYVRAFATNEGGTVYGEEKQFTTLTRPVTLPTVTTSSISPGEDQATGGGNVTDTGGAEISLKGVCWHTSPEPSIAGTRTLDGPGAGSFVSLITGLKCDTKYYVRAYATNSAGTAYGEEITFSTSSCPISDLPIAAFSCSSTSVLKGELVQFTDQSSGSPTSWNWDFGDGGTSTEQHPSHSYSETGTFTIGLTVSNSYGSDSEVRAGYIAVIEIPGINETGTFTDSRDGNIYNTVKINDQWWMAENLAFLPEVNPASEGSNTVAYHYVYAYEGTSVSEAKAAENYSKYGVLYNWEAAQVGCPSGWHLPSKTEWSDLVSYLSDNGYNYDGSIGGNGSKIAKALATDYDWEFSSVTGAVGNTDYSERRNLSGFSALPQGTRNYEASFAEINILSAYWSSSKTNSIAAHFRAIYPDKSEVVEGDGGKISRGQAVRCVKD